MTDISRAPKPKKVASERTFHNDTFVDYYEWMREKTDPQVISHLEAENEFTSATLAHLAPLQKQIVAEIKSRTKETDMSVPTFNRGYWYYQRTYEGKDYPSIHRVKDDGSGRPDPAGEVPGEELIVDINAEAAGHEFTRLADASLSPDDSLLALAVDHAGDEYYDVSVRRYTGETTAPEVVDEEVRRIVGSLCWSADSRSFFYTRADEAWRSCEVWRHVIGTSASEDTLIAREDDELFILWIRPSVDLRWIIVESRSTTTSETRLIDAHNPEADPIMVAARRPGLDYSVDPGCQEMFIVHNLHNENFDLAIAPLGAAEPESWHTLVSAEPGERLEGVCPLRNHAVLGLREGGLPSLRVLTRIDAGARAGEDLSAAWSPARTVPHADMEILDGGLSADPDVEKVLVSTASLIRPTTVHELDLPTLSLTEVKAQEVPNYNPDDYVLIREWATAEDGTSIPITLAHHKDVVADGKNPGLLYGYGSYEVPIDPTFAPATISLLDRGVVYAVAHPRGGGELGRRWYLDGKLDKKRNTFTDFIACAAHLHDTGWVAPDRLAAEGRSAGGMLMGAIANLAPERFRAIHAGVPFVDALNTILNPELPLTVGEWEEWGNPLDNADIYRYMKTYSPYENIREVEYPAILATTSLNDTRVFYVEPAKWVARLRETVTSDLTERPILLRCEMVAGHGGVTGRYAKWAERAEELSFLLWQIDAQLVR